jgi:hypothetical protein
MRTRRGHQGAGLASGVRRTAPSTPTERRAHFLACIYSRWRR